MPLNDTQTAALRTEGKGMLSALLEDLNRIEGVQTSTLLAADVPPPKAWVFSRITNDERSDFLRLAQQANYTLVIAPECDGILASRCRWVNEAGGKALNSTLAAIDLTADKWALAQHFHQHETPMPSTLLYRHSAYVGASKRNMLTVYPVVCKPRFGAGSQDTFLIKNAFEWERWSAFTQSGGGKLDFIVQSFIPGQPASVAFLIGRKQRLALWPASQTNSDDGRFRYLGGTVPLPRYYWRRAISLAERAVDSVPGLCGYCGVDLILGQASDGSEDMVIEINPRLTTSYLGLRKVSPVNLAEVLLNVSLDIVDSSLFPWSEVLARGAAAASPVHFQIS